MKIFAVLRRKAWDQDIELHQAFERGTKVLNERPEEVRWIRSYILEEKGNAIGTICIYQATSADAIESFSKTALLSCDEVIPVSDTVVGRSDP